MLKTLRIMTAATVALLSIAFAVDGLAEAEGTAPSDSVQALIAKGEAQLAEQDVDAAISLSHRLRSPPKPPPPPGS